MTSQECGPRRVTGLTGQVVKGLYAQGSKSERYVLWLVAGEDRWVLRRADGPAFGDKSLERYRDKTVQCDGTVTDHTLLVERIEILGSARASKRRPPEE